MARPTPDIDRKRAVPKSRPVLELIVLYLHSAGQALAVLQPTVAVASKRYHVQSAVRLLGASADEQHSWCLSIVRASDLFRTVAKLVHHAGGHGCPQPPSSLLRPQSEIVHRACDAPRGWKVSTGSPDRQSRHLVRSPFDVCWDKCSRSYEIHTVHMAFRPSIETWRRRTLRKHEMYRR